MEQVAVIVDHQLRRPILAMVGARRRAAELQVDQPHAVADAEKRHRHGEQLGAHARRVVLIHARRPAGKDDSFGVERFNLFRAQR